MPSNLDLLKVALQRVEQAPDEGRAPDAEAELKNILIDRIASLELIRAIVSATAAEPANVEFVHSLETDDEEDDEEID
jgi:hypothetical protein